MADLPDNLVATLCERAEQHYSDALPYHNWAHALEVMELVSFITSRSVVPEIVERQGLLVVAAAWHDADYHIEDLGDFTTKEERSADLAARSLPELVDEDKAILVDAILETTVSRKPKGSIYGEILHAADVGYFATSPDVFMNRVHLRRQELGNPGWSEIVSDTISFGQMVISESQALMPKILSEADADAWISRIPENLDLLRTEFAAGNLRD